MYDFLTGWIVILGVWLLIVKVIAPHLDKHQALINEAKEREREKMIREQEKLIDEPV